MALLPGTVTPSLQAHAAHLGTWLPFGRAAAMLTTFTQVALSESTVQRLTETTGMAALAVAEAEVAHIQSVWPPVPPGPATAVLSVDGAMVPVVGGEWAEVKTLAVGIVEPPDPDQLSPITDLSYVSRLVDAQQFQTDTLGELHRRGIERAGHVVAVTDGAAWIQGWIDFHCPAAVRILDFAHAAQRLAVLGQAEGPTATPAARAWFASIQHQLKADGMAAILAAVTAVAAGHPDSLARDEHLAYLAQLGDLVYGAGSSASHAWQALQREQFKTLGAMPVLTTIDTLAEAAADADAFATAQASLATRQAQMAYPAFQAAGWPIGSGMVESANKLVVEARMKGSGMHWAAGNVDGMLALRNAVCNDRWEEVCAAISRERRQADQRARCCRQQQRRPPAPPATPPPPAATPPPRLSAEVLQQIAEPPREHPWKRPFSVRRQIELAAAAAQDA